MVKYVTRLERFEAGDFPMVCARSGKAATKMVPVQAYRSTVWPFLFFPGFSFILAKIIGDSNHPWGKIPFAEGEVGGVAATYERPIGVMLKGVHPDFVAAVKESQGRSASG